MQLSAFEAMDCDIAELKNSYLSVAETQSSVASVNEVEKVVKF